MILILKRIIVFSFAISAFFVVEIAAQNTRFVGTYEDGYDGFYLTRMQLNDDGSFRLYNNADPIFTQRFDRYVTDGNWISKGDTVILNPDKQPRYPLVTIKESRKKGIGDTIAVNVGTVLNKYKDGILTESSEFELSPVSVLLYHKRKKKVYHLVPGDGKSGKVILPRGCLFSPRVKNMYSTDLLHTARVPYDKSLTKVGIYSYGFAVPVEIDIIDPETNYLEVSIILSVDEERMPRSKKVLVRKNKAYYYEYNGKIDKGLTPLKKVKE